MKGKIDHIGMWTWGGRVYNWTRYLDNMRATGMDTVVLWHYHAPARAAQIQDYARSLGIALIWGFNWSWGSPVCMNSEEDIAYWREEVLKLIETEYAPLNPDGVCFQVGGTETGCTCRLDCDVCREGYKEGIGPIYVKFAGALMDAVQAKYPDLYICANLHLGGVHKSFEAVKAFNPSINMMWEDLPGPQAHLEVPFSYNWADPDAKLTQKTLDMVERMGEINEDVAFIVKSFPCWWGGHDPMLLEEMDLKAIAATVEPQWEVVNKNCENNLGDALKVFRLIADAPARKKTVLMLVERALWDTRDTTARCSSPKR